MTAEEPWSGHDFVFVGGMHRSGTTTLAGLIGNAPDASSLAHTGNPMDEGQFLQDAYPSGRLLGGMTAWALDSRAYADEDDAARVPGLGAHLWDAWSPYWDLTRAHLVEKTPLNLTRTRFLQAALPPSAFVVITRHPVTQALAVSTKSKQRAERFGRNLPRMVEGWVRAHEAFARDEPHLRRVHVVRYEHLMSEPDRVLADVQAFLGFDLPLDQAGEWDASRSRAYADRWAAGTGGRRVLALPGVLRNAGRGKVATKRPLRDLADRAQFPRFDKEIRARFGARIEALGYELDDLGTARPWSSTTAA